MTKSKNKEQSLQVSSDQQLLADQLKRVELINGRTAMIGFVIGIVVEGLTGQSIFHQLGLGPLVDGYAACHTQFLPFCF